MEVVLNWLLESTTIHLIVIKIYLSVSIMQLTFYPLQQVAHVNFLLKDFFSVLTYVKFTVFSVLLQQ